jgi:putative transposase
VSGRKRHLLVDTQGFVLKVVVSAAEVQDRDGARLLAHAVRLYGPHLPRLSLVWADAAYAGQLVEDLRELMGWTVEVVKRSETQPCSAFAAQRLCRAAPLPRSAFAAQPHRWIVERTFSWLGGCRRLSKDYEYQVESSEALIYAAMSHLMLRRLTRSPVPSSPTG